MKACRGIRWTARLLCLGAIALCAGCVVIPVNLPDEGSRRNIAATSAQSFTPGVTTHEEVILQLGEPDVVSADQRSIGYAWSRIRFFWVVGSYGGGAVGKVSKQSFLRIAFDGSGRFVSAEVTTHWFSLPEEDLPTQPDS